MDLFATATATAVGARAVLSIHTHSPLSISLSVQLSSEDSLSFFAEMVKERRDVGMVCCVCVCTCVCMSLASFSIYTLFVEEGGSLTCTHDDFEFVFHCYRTKRVKQSAVNRGARLYHGVSHDE